MKHSVEWLAPSPLWDVALEDQGPAPARFKQPALLRFVGDGFVEEIQARLAQGPAELAGHVARSETWESEAVGWLAEDEQEDGVLKLFQPAHNRFYLAAASLVCRRRGLPERAVDPAKERLGLLLRRLVPRDEATGLVASDPESFDEMAWIGNRQQGAWSVVGDREHAAAGEERLPLFPLPFRDGDKTRRLWAGLVPVGGREVYENGARQSVARPSAGEVSGDPLADRRFATLASGVLAGLDELTRFPEVPAAPPPPDPVARATQLDEQARETLVYTLLDLADFLADELPMVSEAIAAESAAGLAGDALLLWNHLDQPLIPGGRLRREVLKEVGSGPTRDALIDDEPPSSTTATVLGLTTRSDVRSAATSLLGGTTLADHVAAVLGDPRLAELRDGVLPGLERLASLDSTTDDTRSRSDLLFWLLDASELLARELPESWAVIATGEGSPSSAETQLVALLANPAVGSRSWSALLTAAAEERTGLLGESVEAEITVLGAPLTTTQIATASRAILDAGLEDRFAAAFAASPPGPPTPPPAGGPDPADGGLYVLRCVYERPECGALNRPVVSRPSRAFQLAPFFDPEAPVRPLKIRLPDTGIGHLRKFPKAVSFELPKKLRQQMERAQQVGLKGLVDGDSGDEPQLDFGVITIFSIPIITICALILLMIIVQLLNIVFWWLPLFKITVPIPRSSS